MPRNDLPEVVTTSHDEKCGAISLLGRRIDSMSRSRERAPAVAVSSGPMRAPRPVIWWHREQAADRA